MNLQNVAQVYAQTGFFHSPEHAMSALKSEEHEGVVHISIFNLDAQRTHSAYSVYFDEKKATGHVVRMGYVKDNDSFNDKTHVQRATAEQDEATVYSTLVEQAEMRLREIANEKKTLMAAILMLVAFADQGFIALMEGHGFIQSVMKGKYITMIKMVK